ncbi:MAG TPA: class I SAM-dependent methyltransferase [Allosphingosinicella sp.]|nr:class I SAM-dependent methyltransferase [Allosphingosinicella sp.]
MTTDEARKGNIDPATVDGFGREWATFDQVELDSDEHAQLFEGYFSVFPFATLPAGAEGFDLGCGSGRWAALMAPRVGTLHCIDPSSEALDVTRRRLAGQSSARFHLAGADSIPLADGSQDFGYSLGVLHHIPDTRAAMRDCVKKLKIGAPFLVYLYYDFDNKPGWFRMVWKGSDMVRRVISRLPFRLRKGVTDVMAVSIYWPLTRTARVAERLGANVSNFPLSAYRRASFYTMRTDSLDRFGTRLEHRFTRAEIEAMMTESGLIDIRFREDTPYWVACGRRAS